jgi:hypothetical protein
MATPTIIHNKEQSGPGGVTGFEAPAAGHYHYGKQPGDLTHYGDAAMIGAWLGAANGVDGIPSAWRKRLNRQEEIHTLVERVVALAEK